MRPLVSVLLCAVMIAGLLVYVPSNTEALPNDATISGTVTDGVDPIEGAYVKVMLMMADGIGVNYSFSDVSGYYEMGVPGGFDYMVFAVQENCYFAMTMLSVGPSESVTYDFVMTAIAEPKDVTVKGFVKDDLGSPVTDGHVIAITHDLSGASTMPYYGNLTVPDGTGYYEATVIAGDYGGGAVLMDIPGYLTMVGNESYDPYVSGMSYWCNLTLPSTTYSDDCHVSGTVTDGYGTPLEFVMVSINSWNPYMTESYYNYTWTDVNGHYDLNFTNGTAEITFSKGGYTSYMQRSVADPGLDVVLDVGLYGLTGTMAGYVTDLSTGLPVANARVMQMWSYWTSDSEGYSYYTMGYTDASGYYEIQTWPADGPNSGVGAEADGYASNWTQMDVSGSGTLLMDFGLWPVNAWIEGTVTDYLTGAPIQGAWVYAQSDVYGTGANTDSTGYYSLSVPAGYYNVNVNAMDYMNAQTEVSVPDGSTVTADFELLPMNLPDTTKLYGWVNTTGTMEPVVNAEVRVALQANMNMQNSTYTNDTGYYEIMAPSVPLAYRATAWNHGLTTGTVDATGMAEIRLDILLLWDECAPNVTYSQAPTENISWTNPSVFNIEVQELNLNAMLMFQFMYYSSAGDFDTFYVIAGSSVSFDPWSPGGDLPYSVVGDVYTVDISWNGSATGGWLSDGSNQAYLWASEVWMYGTDPYYLLRGYYSNSTVTTPQPGTAFFDETTGAFYLFQFDDQWTYGTADGSDLTGVFSPTITRIDVNRSNPSDWTWIDGTTAGDWSVGGMSYTYDTIVPSVAYKVMFMAYDYGSHWYFRMTNETVDNELPVADAGADQTAVVNTTVSLDAGGSSDNVGIVDYSWQFDLSPGDTVTLTGETVDYVFDTVGDYVVTLTVVDGAGHSSSDTMTVTVVADEVPVADAGPDQTVDEGTLVTFDGSGSTDDLGIVGYAWTIVELSVDLTGVAPEYTFVDPGTYHVELVVEDTIGQFSAPDEMVVTVVDVTAPTADAGPDQEVDMGATVTFDGSGSTDNVGIVSWEWTFYDGGDKSLSGETATYTFDDAGVFVVTLTVADAAGNTDTDTMTVTVLDTEAPFADAGADVTVTEGDTVHFNGTGSTDNVGIVSYTWTFTDVTAQVLTGAEPEYTFDNVGDFTVTLTVVDAEGYSDTDEMVVHVLPSNAAPTADAGDDQTVTAGDTVHFNGTGSADDGGAENLNYTWTFEYDGETRTIYGAEPEFTFDIAGTYDVTLVVRDEGGLTSTDTVRITVEESGASFIEQYWWALAALAVVVVAVVLAVILMGKGKGGKPSKKPKSEDESGDEAEDEEPPAPEDEEL